MKELKKKVLGNPPKKNPKKEKKKNDRKGIK